MEVHPLTLAALATSAVSGLQVTGYQKLYRESTYEETTLLETSMGQVLAKIPLDSAGEVKESAEILSLTSLSEGLRGELPFEVPLVLGIAGIQETRMVITSFLPGTRLSRLGGEATPELLESIARALLAISNIPMQPLKDYGLSNFTVDEIRTEAAHTLTRAEKTGLVPPPLISRWMGVIDDDSLWDFLPSVVHGNLDEDQFLVEGGAVTGIIGWSRMQVSDPAIDFAWLFQTDFALPVLDLFAREAQLSDPDSFAHRASFWGEFQLARWLLHGVDTRQQDVVDDAIAMFGELLDNRIASESRSPADSSAEQEPDPEAILAVTPTIDLEATGELEFEFDDDFDTSDIDFFNRPEKPAP